MDKKQTEKKERTVRGRRHGIRRQILTVFLCAVLVPLLFLGILMIRNQYRESLKRLEVQASAECTRITSTVSSTTTMLYQSVQATVDNLDYRRLLSSSSYGDSEQEIYEELSEELDALWHNLTPVQTIAVYTDNPNIPESGYIHCVDLSGESWYRDDFVDAWWCLSDAYINKFQTEQEFTLVRRFPVGSTEYRAYLVAQISDDDMRNVLLTTDYDIRICFDGDTSCFFSSENHYGNTELPVSENPDLDFHSYRGILQLDGSPVIAASQVLSLYNVGEKLIVLTCDRTGYQECRSEMQGMMLIVLFAMIAPIILILVFSFRFSRRINQLRSAMHRASTGDYSMTGEIATAAEAGDDELTDTFRDLETTTANIQKREKEYYRTQLRQQELVNRQQEMEFKMLASQINPHFLYNTLETIRMQALANRDRDTARSILLLSQSMHYVLENIGTKLVPISRELDQVERYLKIQQLRFGDRVSYDFYIAEDVDPEHIAVLPLMIQPVVENAVNYGVEPKIGRGHVSIILERMPEDEHKLLITIKDNGQGMDEETLRKITERVNQKDPVFGKSIGLANINHRIRSLYGEDCGLVIRSTPGKGTSVEMTIRIRDISDDDQVIQKTGGEENESTAVSTDRR